MRRPRHDKRGERMIDRMAESIAETGDVGVSAKALGIGRHYAAVLFQNIRKALGRQAV